PGRDGHGVPPPRHVRGGHRRAVRRDGRAARRLLRARGARPRRGRRRRPAPARVHDRDPARGRPVSTDARPPAAGSTGGPAARAGGRAGTRDAGALEAHAAVDEAWRAHWSRLVALVVGQYGRPDLAEDAVADAFAAAARTWPDDGVPANPAGWLLTSARRRVLDRLRTEAVRRRREPVMVVDEELRRTAAAVEPGAGDDAAHLPDETVRLLFSCCHPALAPDARTALTLRFV